MVIDLRKMRTRNLKFRKDLWDTAYRYGWLVSNKDGYFQLQILSDCSKNLKIKNWSLSSTVNPGLYMPGFLISRFICYSFGCKFWLLSIQNHWVMPKPWLFSFVCTSDFTVLFSWNLSWRPFLGLVVDLDLLLCTGFDSEHGFIHFRDQWMIAQLS